MYAALAASTSAIDVSTVCDQLGTYLAREVKYQQAAQLFGMAAQYINAIRVLRAAAIAVPIAVCILIIAGVILSLQIQPRAVRAG